MKEVWKVLVDGYAQEEVVENSVNAEVKIRCLMEFSVPEHIVKHTNYLPNLEVALRSVNGFQRLSALTQVECLALSTLKDLDYCKAHNKGSITTFSLQDQYDMRPSKNKCLFAKIRVAKKSPPGRQGIHFFPIFQNIHTN